MEIRRFIEEQDAFDDLIELFKTGLGNTDREFWQWKYFSDNSFDKQIIYIITNQNKIIAMMGFIPLDYIKKNGKVYHFVSMCDLVVHPEYRGQGLFYKIYHYAEQDLTNAGYEAFVSFPNHNSLHGFKNMHYTIMYMKSYSLGVNIKGLIFHKLGLGKQYVNKSWYDIKICSENFGKITENRTDNDKWLVDDSIKLNISREFLSWRCEQYSSGKYKYITVKENGNLAAYFIVLITKGRKITAGKIVSFDIKSRYINDIKTIADEVKRAIYSFADMIDFYGIWDPFIEAVIMQAFGIAYNKVGKGSEFIIHSLGDNAQPENPLFINYIDTDL